MLPLAGGLLAGLLMTPFEHMVYLVSFLVLFVLLAGLFFYFL
jgi:hypothetical protein